MTNHGPLRVRTRAVAAPSNFEVTEYLPQGAMTFIRNGEGLVGAGVSVQLEAKGEQRFAELDHQFSSICENAIIDDSVGGIGRGLVAFGAIAFSDSSAEKSVLIIPKLLLGIRDGRAWITQTWFGEDSPAEINNLTDFEQHHNEYLSDAVELHPGQISAAKFEHLTQQAIGDIQQGVIDKIVLARDLHASLPEQFDLRRALARLAKRYPNCWTYSVDGTFGASPELLVRVRHAQVSARVLAGTASRGTDPQVDRAIANALVESTKNNREHQFAIKSLVASLEEICDQVIADEKPFSLALPNVWHLASDVTAVLKQEQSSLTLAAKLHPTAAVAGTPTEIAIGKIAQLEQVDRGRYAGPVGWLSASGDGEWAIALRGGQISQNEVRAFAGCGLVAQSDPSAELSETELKFQPVRYALN